MSCSRHTRHGMRRCGSASGECYAISGWILLRTPSVRPTMVRAVFAMDCWTLRAPSGCMGLVVSQLPLRNLTIDPYEKDDMFAALNRPLPNGRYIDTVVLATEKDE